VQMTNKNIIANWKNPILREYRVIPFSADAEVHIFQHWKSVEIMGLVLLFWIIQNLQKHCYPTSSRFRMPYCL